MIMATESSSLAIILPMINLTKAYLSLAVAALLAKKYTIPQSKVKKIATKITNPKCLLSLNVSIAQ